MKLENIHPKREMNRIFPQLLLIAIFSISGLLLNQTVAQSLAFSRVVKVSAVADTVPVGKVWKVESFWQAGTTDEDGVENASCTFVYYHHPFKVDGQPYYTFEGGPASEATGDKFKSVGNDFPLWLPAGTTVQTICPVDFLSVLEFNVGP